MSRKSKFPEDFYVFLTPKDNPDTNSYIKIIDLDCPFAGVVFVVNTVSVPKTITGKYKLKYDYAIIEPPDSDTADTGSKEFDNLVGDIIVDVWDKYYA